MKKPLVLTALTVFFLLGVLTGILILQDHYKKQAQEKVNAAYNNGYEAGNQTGYNIYKTRVLPEKQNQSFQKGVEEGREQEYMEYEYSNEISNPNTYINWNGNITLDNYTFIFKNKLTHPQLENRESAFGYTYTHNNTIILESGEFLKAYESECDHEIMHNMFPEFTHPSGEQKFKDPIYRYSDNLQIKTCDRLVSKLEEKD